MFYIATLVLILSHMSAFLYLMIEALKQEPPETYFHLYAFLVSFYSFFLIYFYLAVNQLQTIIELRELVSTDSAVRRDLRRESRMKTLFCVSCAVFTFSTIVFACQLGTMAKREIDPTFSDINCALFSTVTLMMLFNEIEFYRLIRMEHFNSQSNRTKFLCE